jgi:putative acetyltransferase
LTGAAGGRIAIDDPRARDVRELLGRHLAFAADHSPPQDMHALDVDALAGPGVTFFSYRRDGELLGVAALKRLDDGHAELKSMHTARTARGAGVARALLEHLLAFARDRGFRRVSLETGSQPAFAPARSLYASAGFAECEPFGDYSPSRASTFMTLPLEPAAGPRSSRAAAPPAGG